MVIVSDCLLGKKCRYDGKSSPCRSLTHLTGGEQAVGICPECLGGLPIPREPAEIVGGSGADVLAGRARVMTKGGADVTAEFIRGARLALEAAQNSGAKRAFLKAKSPSCGAGMIYDGTFSATLKEGSGVTAALLEQNGIEIIPVD